MTPPRLRRVRDAEAVARAAAEELVLAAARAVAARGAFTLALAGGTTPRRLYALLAAEPFRGRVPWDRTQVFFGDERPVPPDHPDSNYRMAREALLDHVPVAGVHRIRGEDPAAAERYEEELRRWFGIPPGGAPPRLDLALLGLGADGHTASLFPGSLALDERVRWVVSPFVARLGSRRTTLTLPVLDRARAVIFLVSGGEKAPALARALAPAPGDEPLPAARVQPAGGALWIADHAAAAGPGGPWPA
ncbi:6-phosphogluconolactonase [Anaeromyxobacter paludicola]|uniref:6-phosphogluconolactonase n=1 Tax=Anaeromyxobacter paludicola TaxID=2918171 RepID=A0ABN6N9W7_9BACT|nr:6-phosphogluconolactonase [Anaeromyxobacter paludicola]BDG10032.1 6-phosphogluconolactonase [Anaeromyxobacter paludicola]